MPTAKSDLPQGTLDLLILKTVALGPVHGYAIAQRLHFARTIDAAKKYVVSSTLDRVDWNAELVRGDLEKAVQQLKRESGKGLFMGGVKLPLALAELGLIDEYEFLVQPRLVGHGPTLFAGLSKYVDLRLVRRLEFGSGRWRYGMNREGSDWAC